MPNGAATTGGSGDHKSVCVPLIGYSFVSNRWYANKPACLAAPVEQMAKACNVPTEH